MSVEAQTVEYSYVGDGISTTFLFPARFLSNDDLFVALDGVLQVAGFVITGAGTDNGGEVTFTVPPGNLVRVMIVRSPPPSQLIDFENGQTVLEGTLDNALDKLTMIAQYLLRAAGRSVRVSDLNYEAAETALLLPSTAERANTLLAFGPAGEIDLVTPSPGNGGTTTIDGIVGAGATGKALLATATSPAALVVLGAGTTGAQLFAAANPAAALTVLGLGAGVPATFSTLAAATAATIAAQVGVVILSGVTAAGDAPLATYIRVGSSPSHPGKFQSADGAWWEYLAPAAGIFARHMGVAANGTTDDTTAFSNALAVAEAYASRVGVNNTLNVPRGTIRITSALPDINFQLHLKGEGLVASTLLRDFNGTTTVGFLNFVDGASGSSIRGLSVQSAAGRTNGSLIAGLSSAAYALSGVLLEDLWLTTQGTDTHLATIYINGTAKTTGAIGVRDICIRNVHVFGAAGFSAQFYGVVGLAWHGGGVYAAGGTNAASGALVLGGTTTVKTNQPVIAITAVNGLNITNSQYGHIRCPLIGAVSGVSINNDGTANFFSVLGAPTGSVVTNWLNSTHRAT